MRRISIIALITLLSGLIPVAIPHMAQATSVNYQVASSTDDAMVNNSLGTISLVDSAISIGNDAGASYSGLFRFSNITIPNGANVTSAYLQLRAYGSISGSTVNTIIRGEQNNAAATFSTWADYNGRAVTTAQVVWGSIPVWTSGSWYNSADTSTIIQELVDDYGGLSAASIALFVIDNSSSAYRAISTYDEGASYSAKLYITYIAQPTVTTGAVTDITYSGAQYALLNGNITDTGAATVDQRGFVYGTTSVPVNPGTVAPPASGYSNNSTTSGSYSTGAYSANITGMTNGTIYYVRSIAHNSIGWAYGEEVSFVTLTNPTITNMSATYTTNSTSRLNSLVTFDGNQSCNITFGLALASHAANFAAYTNFYYPTGTYDTNDNPYYNLTSLNATTTYYFNVRITNSYGTAYGTERTFTTTTGIGTPSNLMAIATSTTASLTWLKGTGSEFTLIRYSAGGYPTTVSSGTAIALTTGSSALASSLTSGVTYYFSAWGKAGTLYSDNYTTTMITTLAMSAAATPTPPTATPNNAWVQTPDDTKVANVPILSTIVTLVSDTYNQPSAMTWYFFWIIIGVALGILTFRFSEGKFFAAFIVEILWYSLGVAVGLIMLWLLVILAIIGAGFSFFGDRR